MYLSRVSSLQEPAHTTPILIRIFSVLTVNTTWVRLTATKMQLLDCEQPSYHRTVPACLLQPAETSWKCSACLSVDIIISRQLHCTMLQQKHCFRAAMLVFCSKKYPNYVKKIPKLCPHLDATVVLSLHGQVSRFSSRLFRSLACNRKWRCDCLLSETAVDLPLTL